MRFRHTANGSYSYDEWMAFRGIVLADQTKPGNANEALMLPVDRGMSSDHILFGSFPFTLHFSGLHPDHISHLPDLRVIQNKIYYTVSEVVCSRLNNIAAPGEVLHLLLARCSSYSLLGDAR